MKTRFMAFAVLSLVVSSCISPEENISYNSQSESIKFLQSLRKFLEKKSLDEVALIEYFLGSDAEYRVLSIKGEILRFWESKNESPTIKHGEIRALNKNQEGFMMANLILNSDKMCVSYEDISKIFSNNIEIVRIPSTALEHVLVPDDYESRILRLFWVGDKSKIEFSFAYKDCLQRVLLTTK